MHIDDCHLEGHQYCAFYSEYLHIVDDIVAIDIPLLGCFSCCNYIYNSDFILIPCCIALNHIC